MIVIDKSLHLRSTVVRPENYDFFRSMPLIPLMIDEINQMVALMPIAFQKQAGLWRLVGVTSINEGENHFIGGRGQWGGYYQPRALEQSPLAVNQQMGTETLTLFVDETSSCWCTEGGTGERLFDDNAEPTLFLKNTLGDLKRAHLMGLKLNNILLPLIEKGVLISWEPEDVAWFSERGLYRANPEWLGKCINNADTIDPWLFRLLLAQQFSVAGMNRLRRVAVNAAKLSASSVKASDLKGFSLGSDDVGLDFSNFDSDDFN